MSLVNEDCLEETRLSSRATIARSLTAGGVFELKYLLDSALTAEILLRARRNMPADPHADPLLEDGYRIHSLYFDTKSLDVFHRVGKHRRRKLRLRRYGAEPTIHLESKAKRKGLVQKRRTAVHESELARLCESIGDESWPGHWFHCNLVQQGLAPTTQVSYERTARVATVPEGPIRLTVDVNIRCGAANGYSFSQPDEPSSVLAGKSILEFKFRGAMPQLFKSLSREFALSPTSVSKYRLSVVASGLASDSVTSGQVASVNATFAQSASAGDGS